LSGALQGDPASSVNPHILTAAEDVTRMAGKALFTLNATNAAKQSAFDDGLCTALVTMRRRHEYLFNQFI
jgi:hypothetical protein